MFEDVLHLFADSHSCQSVNILINMGRQANPIREWSMCHNVNGNLCPSIPCLLCGTEAYASM